MELRRKQEEVERLRMEEEDRKAALLLQAQLEKEAQEDSKYRQQLEQERRDHELALRLAQESNGQLDESPTMSRKYVSKTIMIIPVQFFSVLLHYFLYIKDISLFCCLVSYLNYPASRHCFGIKILKLLKTKFYPLFSGTPDMALSNHNRLIRFVFT